MRVSFGKNKFDCQQDIAEDFLERQVHFYVPVGIAPVANCIMRAEFVLIYELKWRVKDIFIPSSDDHKCAYGFPEYLDLYVPIWVVTGKQRYRGSAIWI